MTDIVDDLAAEHAALDARVAGLTEEQWRFATPAEGWDVADSVSHLLFFDVKARLALTDPAAFGEHRAELLANGLSSGVDVAAGRSTTGSELLAQWRTERESLLEAMRAFDPTQRVPWYGPEMSLKSFVTARLMETWAHGQDVADALGLPPVVSDRLRNVCHICVGARAYSFWVHDATDPGDPIRVEVTGPGGDVWSWGPEDAADRVTGTALDLALLVTQRRHRDDTALVVEGDTAEAWLAVAQSFAGPAGTGREPLPATVA